MVTTFNYPEVGATRGPSPDGYRIVQREAVVGHGRGRFDTVAERLLMWQVHRDAGLTVEVGTERVEPDSEVHLGLPLGRMTVGARCRVVYVIDEADRQGFAYGTLAGHPERGESRSEVRHGADGQVRFSVVSFSTSATWWSRAGGPITRRIQDRVTDRYVRAAES